MTSIDSEEKQRPENIQLKFLKNRKENDGIVSILSTNIKRENNVSVLQPTVTKQKPKGIKNVEILQQSMQFIQFFGKIFGCQISYDWRPNPAFFGGTFFLAFTWSQFIYSQFLHIKNDEHMRLLEVFAIYGIALSVVYKLVVFLLKYKDMNAILLFTHKICKENLPAGRAANLKVRLLKNFNFYKWLAFSILLCVGVYVANPLKTFIVDGQFVSLLPIEVMFVDQSSLFGFFIANLIMALMGICSCTFVVYLSLLFAATIMNYSVQVDEISENIRVLDDMWNGKSDTNVQYRHLFLRNICQKQQDMNKYIVEVKKVFDTYIFIYFCSSYISQIICLFEIVANDWKPGYGIAYGMFVEMMFYCCMGSKLTTDNERLCFVLQQSNWYTYDMHSKKVYLILYHSCLNAKELWIGQLAPLTVLTGTKIIKSIFGYYQVLLEVM